MRDLLITKMACIFSQFLPEKDMNFHVYKFSFLSSNWKVCPSKIGFSVTGQETEFPGDENSRFSYENSSPGSKENASHFITLPLLLDFSLK